MLTALFSVCHDFEGRIVSHGTKDGFQTLLIIDDFQIEAKAGDKARHVVSSLKLFRVSDWIYPETIEAIRSLLIKAFPEDSYEIHISTPSSAGDSWILATVTYTTKKRRRLGIVGKFVPIPVAELKENLKKLV